MERQLFDGSWAQEAIEGVFNKNCAIVSLLPLPLTLFLTSRELCDEIVEWKEADEVFLIVVS